MRAKHNLDLYKMEAELCRTFSNPTRLLIMEILRDGERSVGDLVQELEVQQATVSRHLSALRQRGIVAPRREGSSIYYRLTNPKIAMACDIVREVLLEQLEEGIDLAKKLLP